MTPEFIQDKVEQLALVMPRWRAWREVIREFGYDKVYKAYMRSEEWKKIRDCIKKANPVCECCGEAESAQVHHLSYRYVFFENPAYLQAVCRPCHEAMTGIDNYERQKRS